MERTEKDRLCRVLPDTDRPVTAEPVVPNSVHEASGEHEAGFGYVVRGSACLSAPLRRNRLVGIVVTASVQFAANWPQLLLPVFDRAPPHDMRLDFNGFETALASTPGDAFMDTIRRVVFIGQTGPCIVGGLLCLILTGCQGEDGGASSGSSDLTATGARTIKDSDGVIIGVTMLNAETTDEHLSQLASYPELQRLKIQECEGIDGSGLAVVGELPELTRVELLLSPITDEGVLHLGKASSLTEVLFLDIPVGNEGLAFLAQCPQLESLRLEQLAITDPALNHLATLENLKSLSLEGSEGIDGSGFDSLSGLTALGEVNLMGTGVLPDHAGNLQALSHVPVIRLDSQLVNDEVAEVLGTLSGLERLSLYKSSITDAGLVPLARLEQLRRLELSECSQLTSAGLEAFQSHPSLAELDLSGCRKVGNECVSHLATIPTLQRVQLQDTAFNREGAEALKDKLPECTIVFGVSPNTNQL